MIKKNTKKALLLFYKRIYYENITEEEVIDKYGRGINEFLRKEATMGSCTEYNKEKKLYFPQRLFLDARIRQIQEDIKDDKRDFLNLCVFLAIAIQALVAFFNIVGNPRELNPNSLWLSFIIYVIIFALVIDLSILIFIRSNQRF